MSLTSLYSCPLPMSACAEFTCLGAGPICAGQGTWSVSWRCMMMSAQLLTQNLLPYTVVEDPDRKTVGIKTQTGRHSQR